MFGTLEPPSHSAADLYDIAAVCRLTGLSAPNLRIWEKRYQAVVPERSETGRRQYSRGDIQRLTLLKALSDYGHGIRSIVGLPLAELEKRLAESAIGQTAPELGKKRFSDEKSRSCRVIVVGSHLSGLLESEGAFPPGAVLTCEYENIAAAEMSDPTVEADLLLFEIQALFVEDLTRVRRLVNRFRALRAIVVYSYARRETVEDLTESGGLVTAIRGPLTLSELRNVCSADIAMANRSSSSVLKGASGPRDLSEKVPESQFSRRQLARISNISSTVECECPHHIAGLLESLNSFEKYSAQCESRNEADAKIHAYLHHMTAHARATMEEAMKVLMEFEGIDVGQD